MAFSLNGTVLANPVEVSPESNAVAAHNLAHGGLVSYYHTPVTGRTHVHTITVQWAGLTADEYAAIRTEWLAATEGYVELSMDGLGLIGQAGVALDTMFATVQEGTGLDVPHNQGYSAAGDGPIVFDASAVFVSEPQVDF